jgi:hypothetical protein
VLEYFKGNKLCATGLPAVCCAIPYRPLKPARRDHARRLVSNAETAVRAS